MNRKSFSHGNGASNSNSGANASCSPNHPSGLIITGAVLVPEHQLRGI